MPWLHVIWTDIAQEKIAAHAVTEAEVEHVVLHVEATNQSRSTGRPIFIGRTQAGRRLCVVCEWLDEVTVEIITAYEPQQR